MSSTIFLNQSMGVIDMYNMIYRLVFFMRLCKDKNIVENVVWFAPSRHLLADMLPADFGTSQQVHVDWRLKMKASTLSGAFKLLIAMHKIVTNYNSDSEFSVLWLLLIRNVRIAVSHSNFRLAGNRQ